MATLTSHLPYCGAPPAPADLALRWNLDPILIVLVVAGAWAYAAGARRAAVPLGRRRCFYFGWAVTAAALISPLCPLSVSLFAGRVGQHMILALIGAPLVALGCPFEVAAALALRGRRPGTPGAGAAKTSILAAAVFALLIWFWHAPGPYGASFQSAVVYWTMHATVFAAAVWLWSALLAGHRDAPAWPIAAGLFSTVQMGLLGALITLAPRPVYAPHLLTTWAWGLTPLQDQQLGGALMWVPGCAVFLFAALAEMAALLSEPRNTGVARP